MKTSPTFMLDRDYSKFTIEERISFLREFYQRLFEILNTYFGGYICVSDEKLNFYYIKICLVLEKILKSNESGLLYKLREKYDRPFESLLAQWDEGDIWWIDGGVKQRTLEFIGTIDETFVECGEPKFVDMVTSEFFKEVDEYLAIYSDNKKLREAKFVKIVDKQARKFKRQTQKNPTPSAETKKGKIGFIKD